MIMSGNIAKVAKTMCHTKLMTPISNRDCCLNLKLSHNDMFSVDTLAEFTKIYNFGLFSVSGIHVCI